MGEGSVHPVSEPDRPPTRDRSSLVLSLAALAVVVAAGAAVWVLRSDEPRITGLGPATPAPFPASGSLASGPHRAWYSADGARLAVLTDGAVGTVSDGTVRLITKSGGNVVDAAWFAAGTALLVAEGPVPTGGLVVVETTGKVRGTIALDPAVGVGPGLGMTIAPGGKRAVVTAVDRPPFGEQTTRLVSVDLTTGRTTDLVPGGRGPHFVDAATIAFTRTRGAGSEAVVRDLGSGAEVVLGGGAVVGVVGAGESIVVQSTRGLVSFDPRGGARRVLSGPPGGSVVAVHPSGAVAVVASLVGDAVQLREISLVRAK